MASAAIGYRQRRQSVWRFSRWDALLVALTVAHGVTLALWPAAPVIAVGVWWNANTIAHNFIHRPFFRSAAMNRLFSAALSVLLGIPQALWRDRHLAHHAGVPWRLRVSRQLAAETSLVAMLWAVLAWSHPHFFLLAYVPGYLIGLGLCAAQGYWEHAAGEATSHYGFLYNLLCFNDGFHVEHHADPAAHWTVLPGRISAGGQSSRWPALLRWLEVPPLEALERLVLRSPTLQQFVLRCHRRALRSLLEHAPPVRHAVIVGGGLYPRTALILRELLPSARLTIIDCNRRNLETARGLIEGDIGGGVIGDVEFRHQSFTVTRAGSSLPPNPLPRSPKREYDRGSVTHSVADDSSSLPPNPLPRSPKREYNRGSVTHSVAGDGSSSPPNPLPGSPMREYDRGSDRVADGSSSRPNPLPGSPMREYDHGSVTRAVAGSSRPPNPLPGSPIREYDRCSVTHSDADDGDDFDLTVIPLCLEGDRAAIYLHPPSSIVLVHDWIWRPRGKGAVVSVLLLKRINLVLR